MKKFRYLTMLPGVLFSFCMVQAEEAKKEEDKVTGSAVTGIYSKYMLRGYELSSRSVVIQPSVTVSYKGFQLSMWGNIDTNERPTQSFVPDRKGKKSFNEVDLILSYTHTIDKLSLTGGYIYYGTKYTDETEEIFLSASYDMISKPTVTVYRDISSYPGTYINLSFSHSFKVFKNMTFDLAASFGYFKGDSSYWKTYERSTGDYTGEKYEGLHDGKLHAGVTIPLTKRLSIQPIVQYWFPLSDKAKRTVDGNSYNRNGHLDYTWVTGVNITFTF